VRRSLCAQQKRRMWGWSMGRVGSGGAVVHNERNLGFWSGAPDASLGGSSSSPIGSAESVGRRPGQRCPSGGEHVSQRLYPKYVRGMGVVKGRWVLQSPSGLKEPEEDRRGRRNTVGGAEGRSCAEGCCGRTRGRAGLWGRMNRSRAPVTLVCKSHATRTQLCMASSLRDWGFLRHQNSIAPNPHRSNWPYLPA